MTYEVDRMHKEVDRVHKLALTEAIIWPERDVILKKRCSHIKHNHGTIFSEEVDATAS